MFQLHGCFNIKIRVVLESYLRASVRTVRCIVRSSTACPRQPHLLGRPLGITAAAQVVLEQRIHGVIINLLKQIRGFGVLGFWGDRKSVV